jgi:hypothetical protein
MIRETSILESRVALKWAKKNLKKQKRSDESRGRGTERSELANRCLQKAQENHDDACTKFIYKR